MGGICSVRRNGERSGDDLEEEEMSSSFLDLPWDEGYAPVSTVDGGGGAHGDPQGEGAEAGGGGRDCRRRWPAMAEQHLSRLYGGDAFHRVRQDGVREPLSLVELCVRSMCKRLAEIRELPGVLPREVVHAMLASLTRHRALTCNALEAFRECEVTSLSLSGCRGVRNGWARHLLVDTRCGRFVVSLDLSSCTGLTDTGLSCLLALRNLESATLRHCHGLGAEATLCLSNSPNLEYLSLAHLPRLDDAAIGNLSGLSKLSSLDIEGCEGVTDEGLRLACEMPSLTYLNASRCHGITLGGLSGLQQAARTLKRLNLGWCKGLAAVDGARSESTLHVDVEDEEEEDEEEEVEGEEGGEEVGVEGEQIIREGLGGQEAHEHEEGNEDEEDDRRGGEHEHGGEPQEPGPEPGPEGEQEQREAFALGEAGDDIEEQPLMGEEADDGQMRAEAAAEVALGRVVPGQLARGSRPRPRPSSTRRRRRCWELPPLPHLERLCLARSGIADEGLSRLAAGSPLLKELVLSGCLRLTAHSVQKLLPLGDQLQAVDFSYCRNVQSVVPGLGKALRALNLAGTAVRDNDVQNLSRELTELASLNLDSCDVGDFGLRSLSRLTNLERLNLADTGLNDPGMVLLSPLTRLKDLNLFFCAITDAGLSPLATLTGLTRLNLDTRAIGDAGIVQLTRLRRLESLDVFSTGITDFGISHALYRMSSLKSLEICNGQITDRGLQHLSRMKSLTRLNVSQNSRVTPGGIRHLGNLTSLRSLNISCCNVTPESLESLTGLVNLDSLAVFGCRLGRADLEPLRSKLPNLKVLRA